MSNPTVVILGASNSREKFGNKSVRAHQQAGYEVYPVNPKAATIEGLQCYAGIDVVPEGPIERVSVYLPPAVTLGLADAIAARAPCEVWLNPGAESEALIQKLRAAGLNVVVACSIVALGMSPAQFPD